MGNGSTGCGRQSTSVPTTWSRWRARVASGPGRDFRNVSGCCWQQLSAVHCQMTCFSVPLSSASPRRDVAASPLDSQAHEAMTPLTVHSDWGSGYCADVKVSNPHTSSLLWQVSLTVSDMITTLWDAVYTQQGNAVIVRGVAWNRILAPRQSTVFGFCATHQQSIAR